MPSLILPSVIMPSVITPSVIMPNVLILIVSAPSEQVTAVSRTSRLFIRKILPENPSTEETEYPPLSASSSKNLNMKIFSGTLQVSLFIFTLKHRCLSKKCSCQLPSTLGWCVLKKRKKHYGLIKYGFQSKLVCLSKPVKVTDIN